MKLNTRNSGLPTWPAILQESDGVFVVVGKHATYWRYAVTQGVLMLAMIAALVLPWALFHDNSDAGVPALLGGFGFIAVAAIPFTPRILCRMFFARVTRVEFTPHAVKIGRKTYEIRADAAIQFRAQRAALNEFKIKKLENAALAKREGLHSSYKLRFRWVEMIYGLRVVPIATVADELRAEQFAIALQEALRQATSPGAARSAETTTIAPASPRATAQDALPE